MQVLFFLCGFQDLLTAAQEYMTIDEALQVAFPESEKREAYVPSLSQEQARLVLTTAHAKAKGKLDQVYIASSNGALDGIVFIDNAIGRTEYFTYACAVNARGQVKRIDVLTYREPVGSEIRGRSWLQRFNGKNATDKLTVKRDIPNINGASLSCKAMTERVRFLLVYFDLVLLEQVQSHLAKIRQQEAVQNSVKPIRSERSEIIGEPVVRVSLQASGDGNAISQSAMDALAESALATARAWDAVTNTWSQDAELSRVVKQGGGRVSPELARYMEACLEARHVSQGAVDISIRPLLDAWTRAEKQQQLVSVEELASLRQLCRMDLLKFTVETRALKVPTGMTFDGSALAKGWIIDRVYDQLTTAAVQGLCSYGESSLRALAVAQPVAIRDPRDPAQQLGSVLLQPGQGLSTSGSYHRVMTINDQVFSHFVDPKTGTLLEGARAATVIAATASEADVLSTMACILAPEQALKIIESIDGAEAFIARDEKQYFSSAWQFIKN